MNNDFIYYRMRASRAFSVKGSGTFIKSYSVKAALCDNCKELFSGK